MQINLDSVDQTQFHVKIHEGEDKVLIVPRPDKHRWEDDELWFRSVVTDLAGNVLSRGLPKFMNLHERPEYHLEALDKAPVAYAHEKADGSLIIVSYPSGWETPYIRTRGSIGLGEFEAPVTAIIQRDHPQLLSPAFKDAAADTSALFEYTAPDNRIVVDYREDRLVYLGQIVHEDSNLGVPMVVNFPQHLLDMREKWGFNISHNLAEGEKVYALIKDVPNWDEAANSEGIVVTCRYSSGHSVMFKVKSQWYLMMHALRFQMTAKKLAMLLVLEHAQVYNFSKLQDYLYSKGYDFEIAEILETETHAFFARRGEAMETMMNLIHLLDKHPIADRGEYVRTVRALMVENGFPPWIFHYAMAAYDKNPQARRDFSLAIAAQVSVRQIQDWFSRRDELIDTLIKTPKQFEEEEE